MEELFGKKQTTIYSGCVVSLFLSSSSSVSDYDASSELREFRRQLADFYRVELDDDDECKGHSSLDISNKHHSFIQLSK